MLRLLSDCRAWVVATFAGGGYTKNNVARCWTNETAALVGRSVPEELPPNTYLEYYAPDHRLNLHSKKSMENSNARAELERIRRDVMENLRHLAHTPGAPCHAPPHCVSQDSAGGSRVGSLLRQLQLACKLPDRGCLAVACK